VSTTTPDGGATATTLTGPGYLNVPNVTINNDSTSWSCSVFLKQGTATNTEIKTNLFGGTSVNSYAQIGWASKTLSYTSGGSNYYSLQAVGNGWYRITTSVTNNSSGNTTGSCYVTPDTSGSSGTVLAWGLQMENLPNSTSYIPTTSVALSRNNDVAQVLTSGSWFNAVQGTAVGWFSVPATRTDTNQFVFDLDDGTGNNRMGVRTSGATGISMEDYVGNVSTSSVGFGGVTLNTNFFAVYGFKNGNFGRSFNGAATVVSTAGSVPTVTTLQLGQYKGTAQFLNGWLRSFAFYNTRLSNAQISHLATNGLP
jgi:hypothetical protein